MEEIIRKSDVPEMPGEIKIQTACRGALPGLEIEDISEAGCRDIVEKVRSWDAEAETAWACFDPAFLDSDEEAPIEPSDSQSVFPMKCTMRDRDLAAKCVEWYIHTCEPYPGMDWLKEEF